MEQPYIIGIRFQKSGKVYHFDASRNPDIQPHDFVVVETVRGRQLGEVIGIVTNLKPQDSNLKPIQRKATPRDLVLRQIWQCKEAEAAVNCRTKARELGFTDLKIIGAEFSYDGTRLTLLYNSEESRDRPDLRALRRAMSRLYTHTQIELHPLGPRDVAKLLGGMGACGLEERCCTSFMTDFSPISIKMAKEQGISLTPTEITGMCGRLRCCLAYEFSQYSDARSGLPKKNKRVLTPQGEAKVIDVLPLKGAVVVLGANNVIHEYLAHEIQLFDENGVPLPKIAPRDDLELPQDEHPKPDVDSEYLDIGQTAEPRKDVPTSARGQRRPRHPKQDYGKTRRQDNRRPQRPKAQTQNTTQSGNPTPSGPRKSKNNPRQDKKSGEKPRNAGSSTGKRKPPSNQRRNRGREQ